MPPSVRAAQDYPYRVKKILVEIIKLLWKFFKLAFWKWIRPMLGKIIVVFLASLVALAVIGVLLARSC
jgi:hypothetical protein